MNIARTCVFEKPGPPKRRPSLGLLERACPRRHMRDIHAARRCAACSRSLTRPMRHGDALARKLLGRPRLVCPLI